MAWNPGASYAYINMTTTTNGYTAEIVGNGRFKQSMEDGRPAIAIQWTGPASSSPEAIRCSFWFNGRGYRQQAPLRTEWQGVVLWGIFAVDRPTTPTSAQDILDDYRRSLSVAAPTASEAQWAVQGEALAYPGNSQFSLAKVAWQGTIPADRKDWVEFCSQIPYDGTEYAINAWVSNQPSRGEGFVTGLFVSRKMLPSLPTNAPVGFWEPVLEPHNTSLLDEVCRDDKSTLAPFASSTTSYRSVGWATPMLPMRQACN